MLFHAKLPGNILPHQLKLEALDSFIIQNASPNIRRKIPGHQENWAQVPTRDKRNGHPDHSAPQPPPRSCQHLPGFRGGLQEVHLHDRGTDQRQVLPMLLVPGGRKAQGLWVQRLKARVRLGQDRGWFEGDRVKGVQPLWNHSQACPRSDRAGDRIRSCICSNEREWRS